MADPRLQFRQVAAPSFAGAAALLRNANSSFTNGIGAAQDVLSKYDEGQKEKEDNALAAELAGFKFEDDFGAFVDGGGLDGRNISSGMRDRVLNLRSGLLGNDATRAGTESTRASTSRANAAEGRKAFNFNRLVAQNDAERAAAGSILNARGAGQAAGNGGFNVGTPVNSNLKTWEGFSETPYNDPRTDSNGNQVGGDIYRSGYGSDTYTTEDGQVHKVTKDYGGTAADQERDFIRRMETEYNPKIIEALGEDVYRSLAPQQLEVVQSLLHNYGINGFNTSLGGVKQALVSGDPQAVAAEIRALEGHNGGVNKRRRNEEADVFLGAGGAQQGIQFSRTGSGANFSAAEQQLLDSGQFTANEIIALTNPIVQGQAEGQARIDADNQQIVDETLATIRLNALTDSQNLSPGQAARSAVENNPNLPATERLQLADDIVAAGSEGGGAALLNPQVGQTLDDVRRQGTADVTTAAINNALGSTPQNQLIDDLDGYAADPTASLVADTGLGEGDNERTLFGRDSEFEKTDLDQLIKKYARENDVSDEVAALAMREAFVDDPFTIAGIYNRNTLENRFPADRVSEIIEGNLSQRGISEARERRNTATQVQAEQQYILGAIQQLQQQAAKGGDQNKIAQQIAALTSELNLLQLNNPILFGSAQQTGESTVGQNPVGGNNADAIIARTIAEEEQVRGGPFANVTR